MTEIRNAKKSRTLKQVVGDALAEELLCPMKSIMWQGKHCYGVTLRDLQFLMRNPKASRDITSRLASMFRGKRVHESGLVFIKLFLLVATNLYSLVKSTASL